MPRIVAVASNMHATNVANAKLTIADKFRPCYTAATGDETESERRSALLGLGLSHPLGFAVPVENWPRYGSTQVARGGMAPARCENRAAWPAVMPAEWGDDGRIAAIWRHAPRGRGRC